MLTIAGLALAVALAAIFLCVDMDKRLLKAQLRIAQLESEIEVLLDHVRDGRL